MQQNYVSKDFLSVRYLLGSKLTRWDFSCHFHKDNNVLVSQEHRKRRFGDFQYLPCACDQQDISEEVLNDTQVTDEI